MPLTGLPAVTALIRDHLVQEVAAGFPRLTRIPSLWRHQISRSPSPPCRSPTARPSSAPGPREAPCSSFRRAMPTTRHFASPTTTPRFSATARLMLTGPLAMGLRYQDLRMIKATLGDPMSMTMMAQTRANLAFVPRDDFPPNLVPDQDPKNLKPAKAPQLRRLYRQRLQIILRVLKREAPWR